MRHPSTNMAVVWQIRSICYVFNHGTVERGTDTVFCDWLYQAKTVNFSVQ